jgi:hypothetical protein
LRQIDPDVKLAQLSAMAATMKRWTAPLLGVLLATSMLEGPASARMLSPRSGGGSCISYDRAYPNGTTLACMVQPGPNAL